MAFWEKGISVCYQLPAVHQPTWRTGTLGHREVVNLIYFLAPIGIMISIDQLMISIYICIYSWPENPPAVVSSMIFPANQTSMTRPGFSSLLEGTQIEKDRERCGKPIFSMVYTTHLWWFWGWFMIVLTTLDHVRGERWRVFHIVLSTLTQGIATIWSEKNQTTT